MKRAAQKWNLAYTDVINFCTQRVVPILEMPSGQVAAKLEQYRIDGERKKHGAIRGPKLSSRKLPVSLDARADANNR
jgi:hypothetical protein